MYQRLEQNTVISGKSLSLLTNYAHYVAKIALHFNCLPTEIPTDKINEYLYLISISRKSPSMCFFKFTVYGLRYVFRLENRTDKNIALPSIKHDKKLPVVLSREEMKRLLAVPTLLKHKVLLGLLYGCGLRCSEVRNIQLCDLDFDRMQLHVRQGKCKKDRYVPLSEILVGHIKEYLAITQSELWLFNGKPNGRAGGDFDSRYSQRGIQWAVRHMVEKAGIIKPVSVHTLRHTYATHLLEDGLDVVNIKELLGHSRIETTLIYLHVAQYDRCRAFSPLDTLYGLRPPSSGAENWNNLKLQSVRYRSTEVQFDFSDN